MKMTVRPEVSKGKYPVHASIPQHERAHFHPFVVTHRVMTVRESLFNINEPWLHLAEE